MPPAILMNPIALAVICAIYSSAQARASADSLPVLLPRLAVGADGYSTGDLLKNLDVTRNNIHALLNHLEGSAEPAEAESGEAQRRLLSESSACETLIDEADKALREAIPRGTRVPAGTVSRRRAGEAGGDGSLRGLQRETAAQRASVAQRMQALLEFKARPLSEVGMTQEQSEREEAGLMSLLKSRRAQLSVSQRRLRQALDEQARKDARAAGRKVHGVVRDLSLRGF